MRTLIKISIHLLVHMIHFHVYKRGKEGNVCSRVFCTIPCTYTKENREHLQLSLYICCYLYYSCMLIKEGGKGENMSLCASLHCKFNLQVEYNVYDLFIVFIY